MAENKRSGGYFLSNIKYALDIISRKWTIDILLTLCGDSLRFSEIERYLSGISSKILNDRLIQLQEYELIIKTVETITPLNIQYIISPNGLKILQALSELSSVGSMLRYD